MRLQGLARNATWLGLREVLDGLWFKAFGRVRLWLGGSALRRSRTRSRGLLRQEEPAKEAEKDEAPSPPVKGAAKAGGKASKERGSKGKDAACRALAVWCRAEAPRRCCRPRYRSIQVLAIGCGHIVQSRCSLDLSPLVAPC